MSLVRLIVAGLIGSVPVILLVDGLIVDGLMAGIVAVALAITAHKLRPGESEFVFSTSRAPLIFAAIPALWMVFQVLPISLLAHPFWTSAESALGHPIAGTVSVDPGASVIALGQYLSLVALVIVSVAVAIDRQRAKWILFALTGAGAVVGLIMVVHDLFVNQIVLSRVVRAQAAECEAIGAIMAAATCIRAVERHEAGHLTSERSAVVLLRSAVAGSVALVLCILALVVGSSGGIFACGCGLGALAWAWITRRFRLSRISATAIAIVPLAAAVVVVISHPLGRERLPLAFAASASPVSERVLDDASLAGTGAGTFASLAPIYREMDDPEPASTASTTAANVAIELGQPMLWLIVAGSASFILILLGASLQRGRDAFYPAMGGSSLITMLLLAFVNPSLAGTAGCIMGATVVGVAFAQSKSRTTKF
jgi:hypothetical protein